MEKNKILIVEDEEDLQNLIKMYLENENFDVIIASDGDEALKKAKDEKPHLIILDIMIPKVDGINVCKKIRLFSHVPIIIVSAKSADTDKVLSLGLGADDYITKPFSMWELMARVKAHLRRYMSFSNDLKSDSQKVFDNIVIDSKSFRIIVDGNEILLTSREFQIIDFLSSNSSQVFSKEQIHEKVWGYNEHFDDNTIAVYIKRIREKLGSTGSIHLRTIWGVGYKWE